MFSRFRFIDRIKKLSFFQGMEKNIILIGFMGTGKSTIGFHLSHSVGFPLLDTDKMIAEREGRSIPAIFAAEGEGYFRDLETEVLKGLRGKGGQVIATGGGIIGREENRRILRELGFVVWLVAKPEAILERTSKNANRPLLSQPNPERVIRELLAERKEFYRETAHLEIETDELNFNEVVAGIRESASYFFSKKGEV